MPKLDFTFLRIYPLNRHTLWSDLIGHPSMFSLESRIFHSISIGMMVMAFLYLPYNLYAGMYIASVSAGAMGFFFCYQYYHSRYRNLPHSSTLFGLIGIVLFGFNYFANAGINGSTDLIWPAYLLLVFAISPYSQHFKWLMVYLCAFTALHIAEYHFPSLVKYPFHAGTGQFIDRITIFPMPVIAVYIIIRYIRQSHDKERKAAEEKAIAILISKEQILLQKEQLEQSNREKNRLMSIISHDLRMPLMNVQGYLALLNENDVNSSDRPVLEKALLKSTNSAMEMLSNLLHWSKSQMEGSSVNLVEAQLLNMLLSTLEMEKMHATRKQITFEYEIPAAIRVIADIDMLQLVVRNLISNAIKFTPTGGHIYIHAELLDAKCQMLIRDNGKGIPKNEQHHIFSIKSEPSFGTDNERGVGLGLVLCKEFIEKQGGTIGFESNPGEGSTFFLTIQAIG